ncbi:MAG: hypothetical protein HC849_32675 [Oscillatoriales cyanobacterium RU_3_3]|nr:hypothetical protein [Oscillatoriales cyanobacterium RU_3_3]
MYPALKRYQRWAVCPDGALWLVPWAAAAGRGRGGGGGTRTGAGGTFWLIEGFWPAGSFES